MAILDEMHGEWKADGYTIVDLELWSVGQPGSGQAERIPIIAEDGRDSSMFLDVTDPAASAYEAFHAERNDVFLVDREGCLRGNYNVADASLSIPENRAALDAAVRDALGE